MKNVVIHHISKSVKGLMNSLKSRQLCLLNLSMSLNYTLNVQYSIAFVLKDIALKDIKRNGLC